MQIHPTEATWEPPAPLTNATAYDADQLPDGVDRPPFETTGTHIVVVRINRELKLASGLEVAEAARRTSVEAIVVGAGPEAWLAVHDKPGRPTLEQVRVGMTLILRPHTGMEFNVRHENEELQFAVVRAEDVVGVASRPAPMMPKGND